MAHLFREIISCCLALEQPLTIAYLGPSGTYTEAAAIKQFGHFASTRSLATIDEVFREVEAEAAHYGVVPVENSTEGMVNHTLDCFMTSPLRICAEVELSIHHSFMVAPTTERRRSRRSIRISSRWPVPSLARFALPRHRARCGEQQCRSRALVAKRNDCAAIAGDMAAQRYGLRVLSANIEDHPDNKTRFLVIGRQKVGPSGRDKSSILVSTRNEPGALYRVLEPFHRHGISLTRIETRPSRTGSWTYVFFIDFDGHESAPEIEAVLRDVRAVSMEVKSLGSYPQDVV